MHLSTKRPVAARLEEILSAQHIVGDLDTELLQHLESDEHIWNALRISNDQLAVLFSKRKAHKQA